MKTTLKIGRIKCRLRNADPAPAVRRRDILKGAAAAALAAADPPSRDAERRKSVVLVPGTFSTTLPFRRQMKGLPEVADFRYQCVIASTAEPSPRSRRKRSRRAAEFRHHGLVAGGRAALEAVRQAPSASPISELSRARRRAARRRRARVARYKEEKGYEAMVDDDPILIPPEASKDEALVQEIRARWSSCRPRGGRSAGAFRQRPRPLGQSGEYQSAGAADLRTHDRIATTEQMSRTAKAVQCDLCRGQRCRASRKPGVPGHRHRPPCASGSHPAQLAAPARDGELTRSQDCRTDAVLLIIAQ